MIVEFVPQGHFLRVHNEEDEDCYALWVLLCPLGIAMPFGGFLQHHHFLLSFKYVELDPMQRI